MSTRWTLIALTLGVLAALLVGWREERGPLPMPVAAQADGAPAPGAAGNASADAPRAPTAAAAPGGDEVRGGEEFRDRLRSFLDEAGRLERGRREDRAAALRRELLEREARGWLLPGESAYLQLALLRVIIEDDVRLQERSHALLNEYQVKAEAGWDEYRAKPDVRHEAYRAAEAELVRRATEAGGNGLTQEQLRQHLQELREQYYGDGPLQ